MMKKTARRTCFLTLCMIMLLSAAAGATEIEIIGPNVNFRSTPQGKVTARFSGGEVLQAADEIWAGDGLWYQVRSEQYGDGFVSGEWARPVYNGETIYNPDHPDQLQYVTDNVESFFRSLCRFLYENGYCYWDQTEQVCSFRVSRGEGDESIVRPEHKTELALMLLTNGLLVETPETGILLNEEASDEDKLQAAETILRKHYGTDDIWKILLFSGVINQAETHVPHGLIENTDLARLDAVRSQVDHEYMESDTDTESE